MFDGRRRRSSNVKVMQLFHELKQQFPTIPDQIVTSCISSYVQSNAQGKTSNIIELLQAAVADINLEQMGRPSQPLESSTLEQKLIPSPENPSIGRVSAKANFQSEQNRFDMNESASDINRNVVKPITPNETAPRIVAKRPNHLNIKADTLNSFENCSNDKKKFNIQLSEKCKDVHKLLSSNICDKPPRSPLSTKRCVAKNSPTKVDRSTLLSPDVQKRPHDEPGTSHDGQKGLSQEGAQNATKKETCSTPTQTTDTLLGSPNVNLSLNVNCSLDLVQSPIQPRRTSLVQLTPSQPWLPTETSPSPRSFTSVNFTLRPPASTPQDPIDITSKNSSLTYSTSSFDSQKGLQSRLQITVGPGSGSVSSVRVRPRSFHSDDRQQEVVPARAGSLNDLAVNSEPPVIVIQQTRLERLRIELNNEKAKLVRMSEEVAELEKNRLKKEKMIDEEMEKQLLMEIRHLRCQCKEMELDGEAFYNNIYTGQRGPLTYNLRHLPPLRPQNRGRLQHQGPSLLPHPEVEEGPKWHCGVCTFLNHPVLDKCEQCDMPRIVHGTKTETVNPNATIDTLRVLNWKSFDIGHATRSLSMDNVPNNKIIPSSTQQAVNFPRHVIPSRSAPNMLGGDNVC